MYVETKGHYISKIFKKYIFWIFFLFILRLTLSASFFAILQTLYYNITQTENVRCGKFTPVSPKKSYSIKEIHKRNKKLSIREVWEGKKGEGCEADGRGRFYCLDVATSTRKEFIQIIHRNFNHFRVIHSPSAIMNDSDSIFHLNRDIEIYDVLLSSTPYPTVHFAVFYR